MQTIKLIFVSLLLSFSAYLLHGENTNDSLKITYRNKTVRLNPVQGESRTTVRFNDTGNGQRVTVHVVVSDLHKTEVIRDTISKRKVLNYTGISDTFNGKRKFLETNFFTTLDIGFTSVAGGSSGSDFIPSLTRSAYFSLGILRQSMNLYKGKLLLSYGVGINNYYLKYKDRQNMLYLNKDGHLSSYKDTLNDISKNRTDLRFISIPVLLEFHSEKSGFSIAAGVEFSFNGNTKSILKGDKNGEEFKEKENSELKVNPFQMAALLKLGFDEISVFGKYSLTDMFKSDAFSGNSNPGHQLFSFGVCVFGI